MATVSLRRVAGYQAELLDQAVATHFEALDISSQLTPGMRVLLKPNLLAGRSPQDAVTTHPEVLLAIVRWLRAHGIENIILADSPGGLYTPAALRKVYSACGLDVLRPFITLNEDVTHGTRGSFHLLTPVLEADYIINCAKLKTHGLTVMTAGVKNLFGCIPGLEKPEWHCKQPTQSCFAETLIDLCETIRPNLTFIDAIDCMEGNGPGGGSVRSMGYTLCSCSPYAVDEQAALLMGLNPQMMPIVRASCKRGLLDEPTVLVGETLVPANPPFRLPDAVAGSERLFSFNGLFHRVCGRGRAYPKLIEAKCVGCGHCAESCPKHLINICNGKAHIRKKGCISCFCCQEMCPAHAIEAHT